MFLRDKSMSIDHITIKIYNSRIGDVILISNNIMLLYYKHQFIWGLHDVNLN